MTASNGNVIPITETRKTLFSDPNQRYPLVSTEGKLETKQFLDASKKIVHFFDLLGKAFTPVKYDVNGNIEKLEKKYKSNTSQYQWLNDMVISEIDNQEPQVAIVSLLWLKRALEYCRAFMICLIEDYNNECKTENLLPFLQFAYEQTLKKYHGWMVQKLVGFCFRAVPYRRDLMKILAYNQEGMDAVVIHDMQEFVEGLSRNLDVIIELYKFYNLDSDDKV